MISFNMQIPSVGNQSTRPLAGIKSPVAEKGECGPQDGVSFTRSTAPVVGLSHEGVTGQHGKLGDTGFASALQALPTEGQAAKLLSSEPAPMTDQQRSACIADLETLNMAGQLQRLDPETFEVTQCEVADALDNMANGHPIFYSAGRLGQTEQIVGLEKLASAARLAQFGRVG